MPPPKDVTDSRYRSYSLIVLVPCVLGFLSYWLIVFVDPYGVRSGGPTPHLASHRYPDREWPRLLGPATAEPHDLVLLGGSETMMISPQMLQAAFPTARSPINLSYIAPRPKDLADVLNRVARIKALKHVILFMDFTLLERRPLRSQSGDELASLSKTSWSHAGDFSLTAAAASLDRIVSGTYDLPTWSHLEGPDFMQGASPVTTSERMMRRFRLAVIRHADDAYKPSILTCAQIPFIAGVLTPFLASAARQHIDVDLVFPPLPYILYFDWIENQPRFNILLPGPVFDQFMVFKNCVVATSERVGGPTTRVVAVDTNDSVSGDLRRYMDSAHLIDAGAYQTVLHMIANREEQLTSRSIASHEERLRAKVQRAGAQLAVR